MQNWKKIAAGLLVATVCGGLAWLLLRPDCELVYGQIEIAGEMRDYRVARPTGRTAETLPVVFALHGALDTIDQMADQTGLDSLASEKKAVVIYLQGRLQNWPPHITVENPTQADADYEFFKQMCTFAEANYWADPERIYLVGVSQGGGMVNLITANCSDRIAAAVCNCGWLPSPLGDAPIATTNKCRMLFVVGENDSQVSPGLVKEAADAFSHAGHPTNFVVIADHGHGWGRRQGVTRLVWEFLEHQRVPLR